MSSLILPGDPCFDFTLGTCLPGGWQQVQAQTNGEFVFIARSGGGVLEAVPWQQAKEYLEGGEYEQRLAEMGEGEDGATIFPTE